ncbi:unnamed protein product [marine sediment metagenome]|uniref:Uncharacterized protein n=1 Tax=marine sediment metagenome TaxID=412755 RepID=X1JR66_9ZZZZ
MAIGKGTEPEKLGAKKNLGIGELPSSQTDPLGKGKGPTNKTDGSAYKGNEGRWK